MSIVTLIFNFDDSNPSDPNNDLTWLNFMMLEDGVPQETVAVNDSMKDRCIDVRQAKKGESPAGDEGQPGGRCYNAGPLRICT